MQTSRERIVQHLTKQKACSEREGEQCVYRHPDGLMCAVGCLIPDDKYMQVMEGEDAFSLADSYPNVLPTDISVAELKIWQKYHDTHYCGYVDGAYHEFNYKRWCRGKEENSPTALAKFLAENPQVIIREVGE